MAGTLALQWATATGDEFLFSLSARAANVHLQHLFPGRTDCISGQLGDELRIVARSPAMVLHPAFRASFREPHLASGNAKEYLTPSSKFGDLRLAGGPRSRLPRCCHFRKAHRICLILRPRSRRARATRCAANSRVVVSSVVRL